MTGDAGAGKRLKPYSSHYKADNRGGFGNPPVGHQFALGNPGGPGRPKGRTSLESQLKKVFRKTLVVNKEGRAVRMPPTAVYAERLLEAILSRTTSPAMLDYGIRVLSKYGPQPQVIQSPEVVLNLDGFSEDELLILECLLARAWVGVSGHSGEMDSALTDRSSIIGDFRAVWRPDGTIGMERMFGRHD